ncbi:MAG: sulfite exporter TauE/SafE family protein [Candidatus Xenobia bacterium]
MIAAAIAAAFVGGVINAVAGGGTLVTFSTLLWLGLDGRIANATSAVALWPGSLGGALGYAKELAESKTLIVRLGIPSLLGGALGCALLKWTSSGTFDRLVPWLVLFATTLFAAQGPLQKRLPEHENAPGSWWIAAMIFQFLVGVYGGYFGAGIGILMLTALSLLGVRNIYQANGVKNLLAMLINGVAIAGFIAFHLVAWQDALPMTVAAIIGGYCGARVSQRLGRTFARRCVVAIGLGVTVALLLRR